MLVWGLGVLGVEDFYGLWDLRSTTGFRVSGFRVMGLKILGFWDSWSAPRHLLSCLRIYMHSSLLSGPHESLCSIPTSQESGPYISHPKP